MKSVLILGGGLQALSVSHSLYKQYRVVLQGSTDYAKYGRYIDEVVSLNQTTEDDTIKDIISCVIKHDAVVIIPMSDLYAELLSKNKKVIECSTKAKCAVADYTVFSIAYSKSDLMDFCEKYDIPHPATQRVEENKFDVHITFPLLIKPDHSVGARGITFCKNNDDYKNNIQSIINQYGSCSIQEYIDNPNHYYNVMMYRDSNGAFSNCVILKIKRFFPIKGGSSCYCETIVNDSIKGICKRVLEKMDWHGFADFDVLEKSNGDYRIIEINPRVPASVMGAEISGVNYPMMIVSDLLNEPIPQYNYRSNLALRYFGLDLAWFVFSPQRFKAKPSWFFYSRKNTYFQDFGFGEYKAFIMSILIGLKKLYKKII